MITITDSAAAKIRELTPDEMQAKYALRMRVVGGGCSGLQYQMGLEEEQNPLNRQTGSRSDPRDGPWNQVRRPQGRRARNQAATRDCGLVRSLRTRRTEAGDFRMEKSNEMNSRYSPLNI
jgi:hypothetical protein